MRRSLTVITVALLVLLRASAAEAQRRPRPALSEGDARRAIAATPGFELRTGAVKIREVSARGVVPVRVTAEVTLGVRLARVADESAPQTIGLLQQKRWRAVELRTADRRWEEFDLLAAALGAEKVEPARRALEELATEFELRQSAAAGERERASGEAATVDGTANNDEAATEVAAPLVRGPLSINSLSALGSSAVAEVAVTADFLLERVGGRWRVGEVLVGGGPIGGAGGGGLAAALVALDARRAERARAELGIVREALERYRRERGFYVPAEDFVGLMDHLSPFYIERAIRFDPWQRPYLYARNGASYRLSSAGPDGKPNTPDDVSTEHAASESRAARPYQPETEN
jgi:hypothetical protein